jgi:hypothetical protein
MLAAIELAENDTADVLIDGKPLLEWRRDLVAQGQSEQEWITNQMAKAVLTVICRRRAKQLAISRKRAEAGSAGAVAKWQTDGKPHGKADGKTMASSGNGNGIGTGSSSPESPEYPPPPPTHAEPPEPTVELTAEALAAVPSLLRLAMDQFELPDLDPNIQRIRSNLGELQARGYGPDKIRTVIMWATDKTAAHLKGRPQSAQSATDPMRFGQWLKTMQEHEAQLVHQEAERRRRARQ